MNGEMNERTKKDNRNGIEINSKSNQSSTVGYRVNEICKLIGMGKKWIGENGIN